MPEITESIFVNSDLLNEHFDPDAIDTPIVSIYATFSDEKEHSLRSRMHSHAKGQLVYVKSGAAIVMLEARICSVLPHQLLWIPGGVAHNVILRDNVDFRAVYLDQQRFAPLSKNVEVFTLTPLLEEVIETMCRSPFHTDWMAGTEFHLQSLLIDKIRVAAHSPAWPALPNDARVRNYLQCYHLKGEMVPRLNELASHCGASERTIHRLFVQGTGMCYQQWRQQVRLKLALELLTTDKPITEIAHYLEFSTTSAFISFFKHHRDVTPKKYRDQLHNKPNTR
jgi:AraC-like DNA-binding protein